MFEIFANSIVYPKNIINYHKKKGGFVFLYILILVVLMTLSTIVFFISHKPQIINEANTGCEIIENNLICTGENYDINNSFEMYDFDIHFISETDQISDITNRDVLSIVVQGSTLNVFVGERTINSVEFLTTYDLNSLQEVVGILKYSVIFAGVFLGLLSNAFILIFIILISTIPFMRFKQYISYKKLFKMLTFAATPMAFLFAVYNLINFDMIIFFILMLFAYRSVFTLQREIQFRLINKSNGGERTEQENIDDLEYDDLGEKEDEVMENDDEENQQDK